VTLLPITPRHLRIDHSSSKRPHVGTPGIPSEQGIFRDLAGNLGKAIF
jgi:hypothetical protein